MKKKNSILLMLVATMVSISSFAQEKDLAGSKDHPLISRYPGSVIETYNLKQFDEYVFPLTREKENVTKSQQLQGKVTRIGYLAPKERSTFEISSNYELALKEAGFEILLTIAGGENWGDINRYLTAKTSNVYVNIKVYAGRGPVSVQLDVIEIIPMNTGMMKVNAEAGKADAQKNDITQSDQSILKSKDVKSFDLKIGFGGFSFTDPMLAGSANNFSDNISGIVTGSLNGFRMLTGPYVNIRYLFNENFGISLDANSLATEESVFTTDKKYISTANLFSQKLGLIGQIVGKNTPTRLSTTLGAGHCLTELYKETTMIPPSTGTDIFLKGKASMIVMFVNIDVSFPLYKNLYLFGNYELNFIPVGSFKMEHEGINDYSETYYSMDFGGSHFRIGLGYSF
ncbi:MAG: hypothetical protein AB9846_08565 [Tenuifilaceae bacterium]